MSKNIVIVVGPCAVESKEQITDMAYKISLIRDIAKPYDIDFKLRGGAWKPRTKYLVKNNSNKERIFEGVGEIGLKWLSQIATKYNLPIVSELMSEMDLRYFHRHLEPERDYIQIGARNSQNYALLFYTGVTDFGVLLKNPQHGINIKEATGSIERLIKNREIVYCTRGQKRYIHPDGENSPEYEAYITQLLNDPNQHPDARNLNNIESINTLRKNPDFKDIKLCHDPSHTWGGKSHEMRKKIGEYAIKAIIKYGYDWISLEVNDRSRDAKCDKEQALMTTLNGIDWSQTFVGQEPQKDQMPITLVDVVEEAMKYQVDGGISSRENFTEDQKKLRDLSL